MTNPTPLAPPPPPGRKKQDPLLGLLLSLLILSGILLAVVLLATQILRLDGVNLPAHLVIDEASTVYPEQDWKQGWGPTGSDWFHHADQGTKILPYSWFRALERPEISLDHLLRRPKFVDGDYLNRFGFLSSRGPDKKDENSVGEAKARYDLAMKLNPDNLPIGFAIQDDFVDPNDPSLEKVRVVGLTCAACHTGEVQYEKGGVVKAIRIEGGPAMINLGLFQKAIGLALFYTNHFDGRFNHFADAVLGEAKGDQAKRDELRAKLKALVERGQSAQDYAEKKGINAMDFGFGRTDALGLIGNRVFGPVDEQNLSIANAPVNFPHLWDTAWFDWVQYNASIRLPLVRNIGEVLGVGGAVNLDIPGSSKGRRFPSTVNVENLAALEAMLGGDRPYAGLKSPKWPEAVLPPIDGKMRDDGAKAYRTYCLSCHLPPTEELVADAASPNPEYWYNEQPGGGPSGLVLRMRVSDLEVIGTDPNQAMNFYERLAKVGDHTLSAAKGLYNVTGFIRNRFLEKKGLRKVGNGPEPAEKVAERLKYDRHRAFDDVHIDQDEFDVDDEAVISKVIVAHLGYKARPLNGIWATAPFLHNGSVPSLDELLKPARERSPTFYLGSRRFDPEKVGFKVAPFDGGFQLDTAVPGNRNTGHEFRDLELKEMEAAKGIKPPAPGDLKSDEGRWAAAFALSPADWDALNPQAKATKIREETAAMIRARDSHPIPKGVIGPGLSQTERDNLLEYLKSL